MSAQTTDRLIEVYIKIRDKRKELKDAFEEKDDELKDQLQLVENELLRRANEQGVTSFKADSGVAYTTETLKANVADKDAFFDFLREEELFDLMQARVSTRTLQEYMDEHDGKVPPGVNVFREKHVRVNRPRGK